MNRKSDIKITVELDDNKMPIKIEWEATDAGFKGKKTAKTLMLSLWDEQDNVTYGIDLWIKEMTVEEMQVHFHQILIKMADTFGRSTNNNDAAGMIKNFSNEFAKKFSLKNDKLNG
ncbi:MAG: gliding motility protein GldC [Ignavibacteriaceae bacterium]